MTPDTGLYVHWPFCARICPYCDFTVTRSRREDVTAWTDRLIEDIRAMRERTGPRRLVSVYFGGGTPSLMPPGEVARVLDAAAAAFGVAPGAEITLEANPTDGEAVRFEGFRAAGINRLSLGVQSFDDTQLAFLGREHGGEEARAAARLAARVFPRVTLDFIYALPGETMAQWRARLMEVIDLGAEHLSFYQLTVEPDTAFHRAVSRGQWRPPEDDLAADLYEVTQEVTAAAGLPAYEGSNHARAGAEAVHNALYWRAADWVAVGPGAHGRLTTEDGRRALAGSENIRAWMEAPFENRYAVEILSEEAQAIEALAGGLRTREGLPVARLPATYRLAVLKAARDLVQDGLVEEGGERLRIPPRHRLLTDHIVARIVEAL